MVVKSLCTTHYHALENRRPRPRSRENIFRALHGVRDDEPLDPALAQFTNGPEHAAREQEQLIVQFQPNANYKAGVQVTYIRACGDIRWRRAKAG